MQQSVARLNSYRSSLHVAEMFGACFGLSQYPRSRASMGLIIASEDLCRRDRALVQAELRLHAR
jgi:hypothetical protein